MSKSICKTCHYSKALGAIEAGTLNANGEQSYICRRYPPTPIPLMGRDMAGAPVLSIQQVNPPVRSDDYCGEYIIRRDSGDLSTGIG